MAVKMKTVVTYRARAACPTHEPCFDAALTNRAFVRQVAGLPFHPDA